MQNRNRQLHGGLAVLGTGLLASFLLSGCVTHHHHHECPATPTAVLVGPPITAAHGYVHHHHDHDVTLVFDVEWGGYWVRDYPDHYYHGGHYYWVRAGRWHRADRPGGPWVVVDVHGLPARLDRHCERIARREAKESWRDAARARPDARQERAEDRRHDRQDHREDRRDARQDTREERHESNQERREERHDAAQDQREERQDERQDAREDRRDVRQDTREERRESSQERRE